MRKFVLCVAFITSPALLAAQDVRAPDLTEETTFARLNEVLPLEVAQDVIAVVSDATSRGLPGLTIANRVLEGAAKGRSGEEVRAAAHALSRDLGGARNALIEAGRTPEASEIEAGAAALGMGVDGKTISEVARQAPSGRSLTVPITVIGQLVERGLPSDEVLAEVLARLEQRLEDRELAELPGQAGRLIAEGHRPADVGLTLASQRAGRTLPAGPPASVPRNNGNPDRPARPAPPQRP